MSVAAQLKGDLESLQDRLSDSGGKLDEQERQKLDIFIRNLDPKYGATVYHQAYAQHKSQVLKDILGGLKPLP